MSGTVSVTQSERMLEISSPLGKDALILRRLSVEEEIGQPFVITAEVLSQDMGIQPGALVGKPITCTVTREHLPARHFHGIVRSFARQAAIGRGYAAYMLVAVPRMWQLARTSDCRIFQQKSVKDICTAIFGEHDVAPVTWRGGVPTQPRNYCVQFNETDLDFTRRILEEIGCGFYFEHKAGDHTLNICGANSDYPLVPGEAQVVRSDHGLTGSLTAWQPESSLQPGKVATVDFDQLKPSSLLRTQAATLLNSPGASGFEMFSWPGGQAMQPEGDLSKLHMEGFEAQADVATAQGTDPTLFAGGRVKVKSGIEGSTATWLVTKATHSAFDETQLAGGGSAGYQSSLRLISAERVWRPAVVRPRPMMPGIFSGIVTGPAGEEIHCDKYGRVKVHFLWDRAGKKDDTSSCWVRVMQSVAGKWGGSWQLPRVGDEVMVAFMDGDPDRPVVIGSVYNDEGMQSMALPANKTQTWMRTRSSKGGGASNYNEVRFEDKKGNEDFIVQAEKDKNELVKNNRTETVKKDHTEAIGNHFTSTVEQNRKVTVSKGDDSLTVKMGNETRTVELGNIKEQAKLGKIEIEAMQSITLTCGQSKIHMTPVSISIESMQIDVKAQLMLNSQGLLATHKADALMTIQGGLVMIN
ncbi:type VI secretion system tip protein VgrG [Rhodovarius crocodyli]|uniref:Type VI secretion system tip protein VgrG n=1 Tax=Rhodovarius crocodyli TaxID=1979269 RepID=A0A437MMF3_9PROT|nr:type VI secretion system tip protein TssI/VgrG [Rhodovarius crocodyli]RVT98819.1 type VI secretion system tip protein VgrG [Rhodovarius crocodyli]